MTAADFSAKNYRPKIKVEGMPPNYFNGDFEHLNPNHFSCDSCDKRNMWDAESFVKHLRGQKHVNKVGFFKIGHLIGFYILIYIFIMTL